MGWRRPYGYAAPNGQVSHSVYLDPRKWAIGRSGFTGGGGEASWSVSAIAIFIALFGWGASYFGWSDPDGKVQLALGVSFILGVLSGYKVRS